MFGISHHTLCVLDVETERPHILGLLPGKKAVYGAVTHLNAQTPNGFFIQRLSGGGTYMPGYEVCHCSIDGTLLLRHFKDGFHVLEHDGMKKHPLSDALLAFEASLKVCGDDSITVRPSLSEGRLLGTTKSAFTAEIPWISKGSHFQVLPQTVPQGARAFAFINGKTVLGLTRPAGTIGSLINEFHLTLWREIDESSYQYKVLLGQNNKSILIRSLLTDCTGDIYAHYLRDTGSKMQEGIAKLCLQALANGDASVWESMVDVPKVGITALAGVHPQLGVLFNSVQALGFVTPPKNHFIQIKRLEGVRDEVFHSLKAWGVSESGDVLLVNPQAQSEFWMLNCHQS